MKSLVLTATAAVALIAAAPALADSPSYSGVTTYGTLGYAYLYDHDVNDSAITGRLGARFGRYLGVEGELTTGVGTNHVTVGGAPSDVHLKDQYAGYAVGYLPVLPNADLFARVGLGESDFHSSVPGLALSGAHNSFNYGVGGQYMFDAHNGIRADFTRYDYQYDVPDANVVSVSYVRKF
jgi:opacity protein-like surface antigen